MSLIEAGPKETMKQDYDQSGHLLVIFDRAEHRTSISTISFLAHRVWDVIATTRSSRAQEIAALGGGGGGRRERARRLDF